MFVLFFRSQLDRHHDDVMEATTFCKNRLVMSSLVDPKLFQKKEHKIAEQALNKAAKGFGTSRLQLIQRVGRIVNTCEMRTSFQKGVPGKRIPDSFNCSKDCSENHLWKIKGNDLCIGREASPIVYGIWTKQGYLLNGIKQVPGRTSSSKERFTVIA